MPHPGSVAAFCRLVQSHIRSTPDKTSAHKSRQLFFFSCNHPWFFIYRYFYRYLLFSESCLSHFIVPSSCIGCKPSPVVLKIILRFFIIFFNKVYLSDTDHQYRHDNPVRRIQSISEPDQFSTAGSYHVYEPIPSGFQNADRCRTVLCHHQRYDLLQQQYEGINYTRTRHHNYISTLTVPDLHSTVPIAE